MTEETKQTEMVEEEQEVEHTEEATEEEFDKERAMNTIRQLREIERKAKKDGKRLAELEAEQQKRKEAEMTELERLQKQLEATQAKLNAAELERRKSEIARKVGLPDVLASRLVGESNEDLEADAKWLLETLPKQNKVNLEATNPNGATETKKESDAERRRRLGLA